MLKKLLPDELYNLLTSLVDVSVIYEIRIRNHLPICVNVNGQYKIVSSSTPVVMSETNPLILEYKKLAEKIMGVSVEFQQIGGATDARLFAEKGATVIMHSGTGEGMHGDGEYVVMKSVEDLAKIQIEYLKSLAHE